MRRLEPVAVTLAVIGLLLVPTALHGWPTTLLGNLFIALIAAGGMALAWWRTHPKAAPLTSLALFLAAMALPVDGYLPDSAIVFLSLAFAVLALGWTGRPAWVVAFGAAAYLAAVYALTGGGSVVGALMFTVPAFVAGTVLRLRRETAEELAQSARELEEERELFADLAVRHERARIAGELHDIVGHAISVMVIQAAAGQRLVEVDPAAAKEAFAAIAESARRGSKDLERLVDLLGGAEVSGPDLSLVDEVVERAARSGLRVTCRFEGDRDGVAEPVAHLAFRVVQESLTNALRYAPGAEVRIAIGIEESGRLITVRVENDAVEAVAAPVTGTGRGLVGLRERVHAVGGQLSAGPSVGGSWVVEARLPGA